MVVAHVHTDLLKAACGGEWGDGVYERPQARHRHASGHTHHIGFGDAAVVEPLFVHHLELIK
jgi:hypothetical protein